MMIFVRVYFKERILSNNIINDEFVFIAQIFCGKLHSSFTWAQNSDSEVFSGFLFEFSTLISAKGFISSIDSSIRCVLEV